MKKLFAITLLVSFAATSVFAQQKHMPMRHHKHLPNSQRKSPHDTVMSRNIIITYGRPYKKDRLIFGGLVPYNKVWRLGADEATQITFKRNCTFGGKHVKAGTYTLFTIPRQDSWTFILNGQLNQWGAFSYEKYKNKDVLKTTVRSNHMNVPVEQFTITLPKGGIRMDWDRTTVFIPVKF